MIIEIKGNYRMCDLVPAFQHLAAQLEDLGIEAVEAISVTLQPLRMSGGALAIVDERGDVERLALEIADLARPCVGSGALRVVETKPVARSKRSRCPASHYRRTN